MYHVTILVSAFCYKTYNFWNFRENLLNYNLEGITILKTNEKRAKLMDFHSFAIAL